MKRLMPMGKFPATSFIDLSAHVEVLPDDAKQLSLPHRYFIPGYYRRPFDGLLKPILNLYVRAGTKGTITIYLEVTYGFTEFEVNWTGFGAIAGKMGKVLCNCSWDYDCTKQGNLSLTHYSRDDSEPLDDSEFGGLTHTTKPSDHFSVKVDKTDRAMANNSFAQYWLKMVSTSQYAGYESDAQTMGIPGVPFAVPLPGSAESAKPYSMANPELFVLIQITDKSLPPPTPPTPPTPIPNFPIPLITVIPFGKEGQRVLDGAAKKIAADWVQAMFARYPQLRVPIAHHEVPVYFTGYASKTGPKGETDERKIDDYDREIGSARANNVIQYLKPDLLGSNPDLTYFSVGRQYAQWANVFKEKLGKTVEVVGEGRDIDRIVVVWVDPVSVTKILNPK
jgi:hypothetical protein